MISKLTKEVEQQTETIPAPGNCIDELLIMLKNQHAKKKEKHPIQETDRQAYADDTVIYLETEIPRN